MYLQHTGGDEHDNDQDDWHPSSIPHIHILLILNLVPPSLNNQSQQMLLCLMREQLGKCAGVLGIYLFIYQVHL